MNLQSTILLVFLVLFVVFFGLFVAASALSKAPRRREMERVYLAFKDAQRVCKTSEEVQFKDKSPLNRDFIAQPFFPIKPDEYSGNNKVSKAKACFTLIGMPLACQSAPLTATGMEDTHAAGIPYDPASNAKSYETATNHQ